MLRLFVLNCLLLVTCNDHQLLDNFFYKQPRETRLERMRNYSLADQYKIYRYGHDKLEPPALQLATPIAEKGSSAIPFLLQQLRSDKDELAVRDILYLLREMMSMNTFDARKDPILMQTLSDRVRELKNQNIQYSSRLFLEEIKNTPERP